jgi:hypothetical protein
MASLPPWLQGHVAAEEAAWEHNLKRLELGYEAEGFDNFRLQLGGGCGSSSQGG